MKHTTSTLHLIKTVHYIFCRKKCRNFSFNMLPCCSPKENYGCIEVSVHSFSSIFNIGYIMRINISTGGNKNTDFQFGFFNLPNNNIGKSINQLIIKKAL